MARSVYTKAVGSAVEAINLLFTIFVHKSETVVREAGAHNRVSSKGESR